MTSRATFVNPLTKEIRSLDDVTGLQRIDLTLLRVGGNHDYSSSCRHI